MTETVGADKATESHPRSAAPNQSTEWNQIDWKKAERVVKNLRYRIFRKAKDQDWKKVRDIIRLMLRSYSNLVVSVKQVTQINPGKNTPGIDGEIANTSEKRSRLVKELRKYQPWKASPVRRVYIPKSNGKLRPLGICTIRDRIVQAVVKNALEPRFEVEFEAKSHGFRPGRCCQDAIGEIHNALSNED